MKDKEQAQALYELVAVLQLVETQTAARNGIGVGELRLLVRVAALTNGGAIIRGCDLVRAWPTADKEVHAYGAKLRAAGLLVRVGKVKLGSWEVTHAGRKVCEELARGCRRARAQLLAFEKIKPFQRITPLE